jgi:hypothetical protein
VELIGRGAVAADPVDLLSIPVNEKQERGSGDIESLKNRVSGFVSSRRPVEDEILFQELAVFRVVVVLLTQQYTAPSAARSKEIQQQQLPLGLRLGQGVVDRAREPSLGREKGGKKKKHESKCENSFHETLLYITEDGLLIPFFQIKSKTRESQYRRRG